MKKFIVIWILILIAAAYGLWQMRTNPFVGLPNSSISPTLAASPFPTGDSAQQTTALFVPYWSLPDSEPANSSYSSVLYFGVEATSQGIDKDDSGYKSLADFNKFVNNGQKKLLVIRMLDNKENDLILNSADFQTNIINQSINIAKDNGFKGVVVDFELSALPFDSLIQQINSFHDKFSTAARKNNLTYGLTMYGDVFYRARPFDIKHLSQISDQIYIMAYDLHKASGSPGPNFPIHNSDYDLEKMTDSFLTVTTPDKLTLVWGLFGYDWQIDNDDNGVGTAQSLSYLQIEHEFLDNCPFTNCIIRRDTNSSETEIQYTDSKNNKHEVWFDDLQSVQKKEAFLQSKGINHFALWAWSYF
ncbi:MAG TPA: glycosyl hydrolase family 18 protein [Patescibacteria group bacterium]|nr:glycosyl hydrolase family 18 protein [Patescibacteria group bacterium]